jgi:Zn-dependent M28 family amino/carboxypeptidase
MTRALGAAVEAGAALLVFAVPSDSAFDALPRQTGEIVTADQVGWPLVGAVRESAVIAQYPDAGGQLAELRAASTLAAVPVPGWSMTLRTGFARREPHQVPNVVGMVRGRDPALRDEYVVITAHFDHVGSRCRGVSDTDRICNGADDNASGTTGLLELAEAFARPEARPRRSMLFVAVSGEERGLWGSQYFAEHPPVPIDRIVANVNMDHLGRNWPDSIVVIGGEHSDLGATLAQVVGEHAELGIGVLPDQWPGQRIYFRSDHYNFAKQGVPILFFTNGFHDDYHAVTDSPDKIDAEKQARVVRLIFYTAHRVADQRQRPAWDPESYRAIVKRKPLGS